MTPQSQDRWRRVREIFAEAVECESLESRQRLLAAKCGAAESVRAEIEELLRLHGRKALTLDEPLLQLALAPSAAAHAARPGELFGPTRRYRISEFLASGGMGEVYSAIDTQTGDAVALKLLRHLRSGSSGMQNAHSRLQREARLAMRIQSDNVCRIREVDTCHDPPYCVMDLVPGETLAAKLARDGALGLEEAMRIAVGLCDGLEAAHQAGVVHRDLKPGNVMICDGRPVIIDFGLATATEGDTERDIGLTQSGEVLGTLAYIAPELLEKGGLPAPASDTYSLGVILFEIITGKKPYATDSPLRLLIERARGTGNLSGLERLDMPLVWVEVIERCLKLDPAQRYRRAAEVKAALKAGRVSMQFRLKRPAARLAFVAAACFVALALAWILIRFEHQPGPRAAQLFGQARQAILNNAPNKAIALLTMAVQEEPKFLIAHSLLAVQYARLDQMDRASEEMLHASAALEQRRWVGRKERLVLEASRADVVRKYRTAASLYREASNFDLELFGLETAQMLGRAGQSKEALEELEKLVAFNRRSPAAMLALGEALCLRRQHERGEKLMEAAQAEYLSTSNKEGMAEVFLLRATVFRREPEQARKDLAEARSLAVQSHNQSQELRALFREVVLDVETDRIDEAIEGGRWGVDQARSLGMHGIAASALSEIGYALYIKQRGPEAIRFLEQSIQAAERAKDFGAAAEGRVRLSDVLLSGPPRRPRDAMKVLEPAIDWYRNSGRDEAMTSALIKWGGILMNDPQRLKEGEQVLQEALAKAARDRNETAQVMALQRLGASAGDRDFKKAAEYWNQALPLIRSGGILGAQLQMARTFGYFGDFATAHRLLTEVERTLARQPQSYSRSSVQAMADRVRAQVDYMEGACGPLRSDGLDNPLESLEYFVQIADCQPDQYSRSELNKLRAGALKLAEEAEGLGGPGYAGRMWNASSMLSLRLGNAIEAEIQAARAAGLFKQVSQLHFQLQAKLLQRRALRAQGKNAAALAVLEEVRQIARNLGMREPLDRFNGRRDLQRLWSD